MTVIIRTAGSGQVLILTQVLIMTGLWRLTYSFSFTMNIFFICVIFVMHKLYLNFGSLLYNIQLILIIYYYEMLTEFLQSYRERTAGHPSQQA